MSLISSMMQNYYAKLMRFVALCFIIGCVITSIKAQVPSDLLVNCSQWKITYPSGDEDKTLCGEENNEYFYVDDTGSAIVFRTPIRSDNGTTPNSSYIRSELRERVADGSRDIFWTTEGSHMIYVKQAITHLPINKSHLVATQIHGNKDDGIDDSMVLRLEEAHLFLSFNGGKLRSNLTIKRDYSLGTIHEVIFLVLDGKHYCYYSEDDKLLEAYKNGDASAYLVKDGANEFVMDLNYDDTYFKAGNYTQSNSEREGSDANDPNNYGEVLVYDLLVEHGATNAAVTEVSLTPNTLDLSIIGKADGPNLALEKPVTGTGTPDGNNVEANLVDGFTATRWSVSGYPQTATIDLGAVYALGRTELVCYEDRAYKYKVSVSNTENGSYTPLVDRSENTARGTATNPIVNTFSEVEGRFLKLTVMGAEFYEGSWVSLTEFRVFGKTSTAVNDDRAEQTHLLVWPNPAANTLNLTGVGGFDNLAVYNEAGKLLLNQPVSKTIDLTNWDSGLYVIRFSNKHKTISHRFVKR